MIRIVRGAAMAALLVCASARAADSATPQLDPAAQKAAVQLLDTLHMDQLLQQMITTQVDAEINANPQMKPYRQVLVDFMNKYLGYSEMKDDLVSVYAGAFTESELKQLVSFYKSPVGQKALTKMPELVARGAQIGQARVQSHLDELRQDISDEAQRLQQAQQPQQAQPAPPSAGGS